MHPSVHWSTVYNSPRHRSNLNVHQQKEWIKTMWYICSMEYYSAIKKEWNNAICSNMDGPRDCHSEWSKSDREGEILYDIPYMWNLKKKKKMIQMTYLQSRKRLTDLENKFRVTREEDGKKGQLGNLVSTCTLPYLKWITNKDLLYSTGNSAQFYVAA